ncbi:MAG: MaoC/PaaZ C-terminal domain-containing protein [Acidimicrobiia bacterium]
MAPERALPPVGPAARFFEDLAVGEVFTTQGRTVTEADGLAWAMFTGDMNPMHVDDEFARRHALFGGRFPPGLMAVAMASGLKERLGLFAGTGMAIRRQTVEYRSPVLFGDTIAVEVEVVGRERRPGRPYGRVDMTYRIVKGDGTVAVEGEWEMFVACRDDAQARP